jgi:hypothetical protein
MPYCETVPELAEAIADMLGIYQQGLQREGLTILETKALVDATGEWDFDHADTCACRQCWCAWMEDRIRKAVSFDALLMP